MPHTLYAKDAFMDCINLDTMGRFEIDNGPSVVNGKLRSRGIDRAFYGCTKLRSIHEIDPASGISIWSIFYGCKSLTTFPFPFDILDAIQPDGSHQKEVIVHINTEIGPGDIFGDTTMSFPHFNDPDFYYFTFYLPNTESLDDFLHRSNFIQGCLANFGKPGNSPWNTVHIRGPRVLQARNMFGDTDPKYGPFSVGYHLWLELPMLTTTDYLANWYGNGRIPLIDSQQFLTISLDTPSLKAKSYLTDMPTTVGPSTPRTDICNLFRAIGYLSNDDWLYPRNNKVEIYVLYVPPRLPDGSLNAVWAISNISALFKTMLAPPIKTCIFRGNLGDVDVADIVIQTAFQDRLIFEPGLQITITNNTPLEGGYGFDSSALIDCIGLNSVNRATLRSALDSYAITKLVNCD